jgi:hypothetical protein
MPPIDQAWNDQQAFLTTSFGMDAIDPEIVSQFKATGDDQPRYKKVVVKGTRSTTHTDGSPAIAEAYKYTLYNDFNGSIEGKVIELRVNDLPRGIVAMSTYANLFPVRWISGNGIRWEGMGRPAAVESIDTLNLLTQVKENTDYKFDYNWRVEGVIPKNTYFEHCHSGKFYDAATVKPALTGKAIDLVCKTGAKVDAAVSTSTFFTSYGFAVDRSGANAYSNWDSAIDSIDVTQ